MVITYAVYFLKLTILVVFSTSYVYSNILYSIKVGLLKLYNDYFNCMIFRVGGVFEPENPLYFPHRSKFEVFPTHDLHRQYGPGEFQ